jgi:hypothetical protein
MHMNEPRHERPIELTKIRAAHPAYGLVIVDAGSSGLGVSFIPVGKIRAFFAFQISFLLFLI